MCLPRRTLVLLSTLALLAGAMAAPVLAQRGIGLVSRESAQSGQRVALVIGNSSYESAPLRNPANDARDMAAKLKRVGFQVELVIDASRKRMRRAVRNFGNQLKKGGTGLFFYAGHGMQVNGVNYLIPIGANIAAEDEVQDEALDAGSVLRKMNSAGNPLNMVFLDACRNNPFARSFRSSAKGLAQMDAPAGSLIVYATAPGRVAADGDGRNGTFTRHLLTHLDTPGLELSAMMKRVRTGVVRETASKQVPWDSSSLTGDFYFTSRKGEKVVAAKARTTDPPRTIDAEETTWKMVENSASIEDFQDYLTAYPSGRFAVAARIKIRQLKRKAAPKPKQTAAIRRETESRIWRDPVTGMEFVSVPGGSFEMGCHSEKDGECDKDEKPVRTVRLDGFWMGKNEVTQGQWKRIMGNDPSRFKRGANYPVESVSWHDVQGFIRKLNALSSATFRLPSEAQWEYACRAGGKAIKYGTVDGRLSKSYAHYESDSTVPVGGYPPNGIGLHDMSGNVWEWGQDKKTDYGNVGNENPIYERSGAYRLLRGGSWGLTPRSLRCSFRNGYAPSFRSDDLGFRLLRVQ